LKVGANKVQVRAKGRNKAGLVVEVRNLALDVTFK
jgi:succinyl-CoA synthetase beta subunit